MISCPCFLADIWSLSVSVYIYERNYLQSDLKNYQKKSVQCTVYISWTLFNYLPMNTFNTLRTDNIWKFHEVGKMIKNRYLTIKVISAHVLGNNNKKWETINLNYTIEENKVKLTILISSSSSWSKFWVSSKSDKFPCILLLW